MAEALRTNCRLCGLLPVVGMAESGCGYAAKARAKGGTEGHAATGKAVIAAFGESGGTYGYRRIAAVVGAGERSVRAIMREENLIACAAEKKRRCSSYKGEIFAAPPNLLCDGRGKHHSRADGPQRKVDN